MIVPSSFRRASRWGAMLLATASLCLSAAAVQPGEHWLKQYGLPYWAWDLDHDADGFTTRQEYAFGTDPTSALSRPPQLTPARQAGLISLSWPSRPGVRYLMGRSPTLEIWTNSGSVITGNGAVLTTGYSLNGDREFFRLEADVPLDGDSDGLSAVEEGLLGTNPSVPDTDGDGLSDGTEVFVTFTNPLVADPAGGTIRGRVFTDPNGDGNTADGEVVAGAEVYLDSNYDGDYDFGEPLLLTGADGRYEFTRLKPGVYHVRQQLAPGQLQTKPVPAASPVFNGLPDEVANYTHGVDGNLPVPYGTVADSNAVVPYIIYPAVPLPVSPDVVLKPIGRRGDVPALGVWSYTEHLTIPDTGSILLRFDELMVDKPGVDLFVHRLIQGGGQEAKIELGLTPQTLAFVTNLLDVADSGPTGFPIDFAALNVPLPVRYLRLTSLNNVGTFKGFEFVGAEAVHFAQPDANSLELIIVGTETKDDNDFARHFRDDPPTVFLFASGGDFRAGLSASVTVQAEDDIAVASRTLTANGAAVALDVSGHGTVPLTAAGTVTLVATATDSAGQVATNEAVLYVNNADGTSPFSANLTGASAGSAFDLRIVTPATGAIVAGNTPVVATIQGVASPQWTLEYAPVDRIDPYQLAATDPDWIPLGSGSGFLMNQTAGTFPAASLSNGVYFLRLTATGGGLTVYHGQVVAKGVAPEDIQPRVVVTSPAQGSTVPLTVPIIGSITSTRPLKEWYAEYAPAATVDLNNLGSSEPPWVRFAYGTNTISSNLIARLDGSTMPDGSYLVRIVAWNDIRLGWAEPLPLEVANGGFKPGRLRREFTDLNLPVGGIPFTIRRVYDSLEAAKDEGLGFGWKLAFFDPGLNETVARTGSGIFGNTPFREGTRVYINTPDGKRVGFTFHAEFGVGGLLGNIYKAQFIPDPGVYEKLETPEGSDPFLTIDGNGNAFVFFLGLAWNPSVYILTTTDGIRYTYDENVGFIEARDLNGNTLTSTTTGLRHSGGTSVQFVRNAQGRITRINAPDGVTVDYGYNANGDLITVTDDDGRATTMSYYASPAHYLKDVKDPLGRVGVTYYYDAAGRLVATEDEDGNRVLQSWNPGSFTGAITDRNGNVTTLLYDARGNVLMESNALGQVTAFAYADPANPDKQTSRTDPRGHTTLWTYDARGNLTTTIRSNLYVTASYDAAGRMLTARSLDGQVSTYTYDALGKLHTRTEPGKATESYAYTPEGLLSTITTPDQNGSGIITATFGYDAQSRLASVRNNRGFTAQTVFTTQGDLLSAVLGARSFAFSNDASGTPTRETDPYGNHRTTTTLPDGTKRVTDRLGRTTDYLSAVDGKVERIALPGGSTATVARDGERNVTNITDAAGNTTSWQYDALNRPIRQTDPTGAFSTIAYDAAGNVIEVVNRNGKRRTFEYDASDRLTHERWHDGTGAVVRDIALSYHFDGWLSQITDGGGIWNFLGAMPRPVIMDFTYPGQVRRILSYSWDSGGSGGCCGNEPSQSVPTQITVTGGADFFRLTAEYSGPHLQRLLWSPPNNFFGPELHFIRNSENLLTEVRRYHNGPAMKSRTTYSWDMLGRLVNLSHLDGAGVPLNSNAPMTLSRDAESRITAIARAGDTAGYTYDAVDQLTGVSHTAGPAESYTYNSMGVRTASHLNPGPSAVGAANRLLNAGPFTFSYDPEGNVTQKVQTVTGQVTRYSYDHRNQLTTASVHPNAGAPATTTVEFSYDYAGRQISRSLNGAKTWILYDREMPIAEFADGANAVNAAFLYAPDRPDTFYGVWRAGASEQLLFTDHLGTVQGAMDASGAMLYWTSYDAFGNLTGPPPAGNDPLRFAGRFYNEALGLYEMRARFYDPQLGRFTQEDPLGFGGGDMNLYRYAGNNPLSFRDPSGQVASLEYLELHVAIIRPAALCSFASCVSKMWSTVATAVIKQVGAKPGGLPCALELFGVPTSVPSLPSAALTGFGYGSNFGAPAPAGVGLAVEFLSVAECIRNFGN